MTKPKKHKPAKSTKKVKKTRKMIVEPFYVYGYNIRLKFFMPLSLRGSTFNNLVRLRRLMRKDKTTLWFALDESLDEIHNLERKIRGIATSTFNDDVESSVIDFQNFFANKYKSFPDWVKSILKLPKAEINNLLITKMAGIFQLTMEDWSLQSFRKP